MPLRLTWIRHAEKQDRVDPSWRKTAKRPFDSSITDDGWGQVKAAKEYLDSNGYKFDRVICSPYRRVLQTASVLQGDLSLNIEWGVGEWLRAGHPDHIFDAGTPTFYLDEIAAQYKIKQDYRSVFPPSSYSYPEADLDCYARAQVFIDHLIQTYTEGHFLIVTHGKVIAYATEQAGGVVTKTPTFCALTSATWQDGKWTPHLLNYTDYQPKAKEYAAKKPDQAHSDAQPRDASPASPKESSPQAKPGSN